MKNASVNCIFMHKLREAFTCLGCQLLRLIENSYYFISGIFYAIFRGPGSWEERFESAINGVILVCGF
nr:hypothetical protein [uncultured Pseudodesulfovibrio sp.]